MRRISLSSYCFVARSRIFPASLLRLTLTVGPDQSERCGGDGGGERLICSMTVDEMPSSAVSAAASSLESVASIDESDVYSSARPRGEKAVTGAPIFGNGLYGLMEITPSFPTRPPP